MLQKKNLILHTRCLGGSRKHYYHFFFGVLLPTAAFVRQKPKKCVVSLLSCGPHMDKILKEVFGDAVSIKNNRLQFFVAWVIGLVSPYRTTRRAPAFDRASKFRSFSEFLAEALGDLRYFLNIPDKRCCAPQWLLIIRRGEERKDFCSESKPRDLRRSLENEKAIVSEVEKFTDTLKVLDLAELKLSEQIKEFQNASVVIAQHGAGLSNILFCRMGTSVIEILPPECPALLFSRWSLLSGLSHFYVSQNGPHGPAELQELHDTLVDIMCNCHGPDD